VIEPPVGISGRLIYANLPEQIDAVRAYVSDLEQVVLKISYCAFTFVLLDVRRANVPIE